MQFLRTDLSDGAEEILTICRLDGGATRAAECLGGRSPFVVQITTDTAQGGDFIGLYDLDGDKIESSRVSWEVADDADIPGAVVDAILSGWASVTNEVARVT